MKKPYYITTPIYYPSGKLTIGNSYTTVIADSLARYHRLLGEDVLFLTGTDEHGQKLQRKAESVGMAPKKYVDGMVDQIKVLWERMNISNDRFIRTTDEVHAEAVKKIFTRLYEQDDIYLGRYEGLYCTPCEAFWTETQAKEGLCPDCGRPVEKTYEECYFLRLSKYQDRLIKYYEEHPEFIQPQSRMNEMLNNFIKPGLADLAVSRTTFNWGVQVPINEKHVIYVWIDALSNYITALNYPDMDNDMAKYWPADLQLMGKDIIRFHTIIWPIMLMALDLPLPKQVFGHGWLLSRGDKLSKSKESKGMVLDPMILTDVFSVDAVRYFLLREIQFGSDGNFSHEAMVSRVNSDLANDLGNLLSRTISMIIKYFPEGLPSERQSGDFDAEVLTLANDCPGKVEASLNKLEISTALSQIWELISRMNKYIDETAPWALAKDEALRPRLAEVLYILADNLSRVARMIAPFMPQTSTEMQLQLGLEPDAEPSWAKIYEGGTYPTGKVLSKGKVLFPRLDLAEVEALLEQKSKESEA